MMAYALIVTLSDAPVAVRKKTVGTVREWRAAGITPAQFRSLTRAGDLVRVRHGVYATRSAVESAATDPRQAHALRVAAARTAVGRHAVASHQSAAVLHGIDLLRDPGGDAVWLTRPPGQRCGRQLEGIHLYSARVPESHVTVLSGVRVTTATRTVVDLARSLPFMEGVVAVDSALRLGKTTDFGLDDILRACAKWRGADRARRVAGFSSEDAGSVLESCARVVFAEAGLPAPVLQAAIATADAEFIGRVDFCWPAYQVIAEADGMAKYDNPRRAREQILRDTRLRDAGYKVVHFTWSELFDTRERVISRIRAAFAARSSY
jgi:predicted transcriptional regulator of viral defense system